MVVPSVRLFGCHEGATLEEPLSCPRLHIQPLRPQWSIICCNDAGLKATVIGLLAFRRGSLLAHSAVVTCHGDERERAV
jgi:hypothetical protein